MLNLKKHSICGVILFATVIQAMESIKHYSFTCTYFYKHFTLSHEAAQIVTRIMAERERKPKIILYTSDITVIDALKSYKQSNSIDSVKLSILTTNKHAVAAFLYFLEQDKLNKGAAYLILSHAIEHGPLEIVKFFIEEAGFNINTFKEFDLQENSFLHKAVEHNNKDLTHYLLNRNAQVNIVNKSGETPLDRADILKLTAIKALLLEKEAHYSPKVQAEKLNQLKKYIEDRSDPESSIAVLTEKRININARINPERSTLLMLAAQSGQAIISRLLIKYGALVSFKDAKNKDAVELAEDAGHSALAKQLQSYKELQAKKLNAWGNITDTAQGLRNDLLNKKHEQELDEHVKEFMCDAIIVKPDTSSEQKQN